MALSVFVLDRSGLGDVLKSDEVRNVINGLAQQIAGSIQVPVDVNIQADSYTTDRAAASVTIAHPTGLALQARDGALTRAASRAGLEVRTR